MGYVQVKTPCEVTNTWKVLSLRRGYAPFPLSFSRIRAAKFPYGKLLSSASMLSYRLADAGEGGLS